MSSQVPPDVQAIAALARLSLTAAEERAFAQQLPGILAHLAQLEELELGDAPAMVRASQAASTLREDQPQASLPRAELLERAPDAQGEFYSVPKTVGGEA
jgi:aspartyl-tRNA(Asn)/glutamyl-tRNA(Gln) amidotransferase subunit C